VIICNLNGGLGNQMFQYAFAKSLSIETNQELKISINDIISDKNRNFELSEVFGIRCNLASNKEILIVSKCLAFSKITKKLAYFISRHFNINFLLLTDIKENFSEIIRIVLNSKHTYLLGYWQNASLFELNRDIILKEFTFKLDINKYYLNVLSEIQNTNSVSIHVRRGDYVTNKKAMKYHGLIGMEYYEKATNYMISILPEVHFFVFSDDISFVKKEFSFLTRNVTIVDSSKSNHNALDLLLMSNCKNNIIANSSFSWWGAWLNSYNKKIVIAPNNWFTNQDSTKLIPNTWIRM